MKLGSFFILAILIVFGFVSWLVAMAGAAALTAVNGVPAYTVGFQWWTVWFQFFTLIVAVLVGVGFHKAALLRTNLFLMVTVCWMIVANSARTAIDSNTAFGDAKAATECILAGSIMTLIVNFLLIMFWSIVENGAEPVALARGKGAETTAPATAPPAGKGDVMPDVTIPNV